MSQLSGIIEQLQSIDQQIRNKEQIITLYDEIIMLLTRMLTDNILIKSEIYLDLRAKYLKTFEDKIKQLEEHKKQIPVSQSIIPNTSRLPSLHKRVTCQGDSALNIYESPKCRMVITHRKSKQDTVANNSTHNALVNEAHIQSTDQPQPCLTFQYQQQDYYINITPTTHTGSDSQSEPVYEIYDHRGSLSGTLQGCTMTLITDPVQLISETISLPIVEQASEILFGRYGLQS